MAEATTIEAYLELKDNMTPGLANAAKHTGKVASEAKRSQEALTRMGEAANGLKEQLLEIGASIGLAFGVKALAEKFVDLNAEVETAQKRTAGLLSGLYEFSQDPTENFQKGMAASTAMLEEFDKAEDELGVDKSAMMQMANRLAPAFAEAGKTVGDIVPFTKKLADTTNQLGLEGETVAQQLNMALEFGVAGKKSFLAQNLHITSKELQKLGTESERLAFIQKKLEKFSPESMRQTRTFAETVQRLRITVDSIMESAGKPFFEAAKDAAEKMGEFLSKNREQIERAVTLISRDMTAALNAATKLGQFLLDHFDGVYTIVKSIGIAMLGWKAAGLVGMQDVFKNAWKTTAADAAKDAEVMGARMGTGLQRFMAAVAAAEIGWQIGTAMREYLETTEWWKDFQLGIMALIDRDAARMAVQQEEEEKARVAFFRQMDEAVAGITDVTERMKAFEDVGQGTVVSQRTREGRQMYLGFYEAYERKLKDTNATLAPKARSQGNTIFNNAKFDIKQEFAEGFDPDRIAVAFTNDLVRLGEMRSQSQMALAGSVR